MATFSEQVAIVTGGAQGLGEAVSTMLVSNGCNVVIFDYDAEKGAAVASRIGAKFVKVDVSSEASVKEAFASFQGLHNRLDIMVNCAGIVGPTSIKTEDVTLEGWEAVQGVNVRGSFLMTRESLRLMKERDYGRILLIASIAGKEGNAGMAAYSTSKAAVIGLAKATGKEYAETGITVNALAPAVVKTAMVEGLKEEQVKYMTDKIPMKRCGTLDEVASIVKFIVSPEASFNTGFTFDLTGGRAVY
ncbi:PREDICTED: uncharacterized protein LOC105313134 [Amphimedon queenslandica]|uniref:3-oxoacyl-ACP reductase n=1 Tax=Amphimedon queenslandica TaxID=400682 RepID=A0A1X7ULF9_AMPQE|nr:PREDICTED: uncharacterized protein LOC105313134 [Amphimedon queenslandica]|eukprot:XP_011404616.1 PREDICTED: uncharacterized protein LOC105313134 [Amphimedon queenslandica]